MAKKESTQKRLGRIRPPRVQLSYDVEIGDAIENKELPFVVGVVGDFVGQQNPDAPLPKIRDRKFVNVDLDNFDDVMQGMNPTASYRVQNALSADGGEFGINMKFSSLDDFSPEAVVQQVDPLRKLLEARTKLSDLRNKLSGNEKLEDVLSEVLNNTDQLEKLGQEAGGGKDDNTDDADEAQTSRKKD
jgi:type VI secretion system protein ImpB